MSHELSWYIDQAERIRNLLRKYRELFLLDNYGVWINLCLITSKICPCFLVESGSERVMRLLLHYRDSLLEQDLDYRLLFLPIQSGVIITTYYSYFQKTTLLPGDDTPTRVHDIYYHYLEKRDETLVESMKGSPILMGDLRDNPFDYRILISGLELEIVSYRYKSQEDKLLLEQHLGKIRRTVALYDRSVSIASISSTLPEVGLKNPRRCRLSERGDNEKAGRIERNWNTEFDRVFELGYQYTK